VCVCGARSDDHDGRKARWCSSLALARTSACNRAVGANDLLHLLRLLHPRGGELSRVTPEVLAIFAGLSLSPRTNSADCQAAIPPSCLTKSSGPYLALSSGIAAADPARSRRTSRAGTGGAASATLAPPVNGIAMMHRSPPPAQRTVALVAELSSTRDFPSACDTRDRVFEMEIDGPIGVQLDMMQQLRWVLEPRRSSISCPPRFVYERKPYRRVNCVLPERSRTLLRNETALSRSVALERSAVAELVRRKGEVSAVGSAGRGLPRDHLDTRRITAACRLTAVGAWGSSFGAGGSPSPRMSSSSSVSRSSTPTRAQQCPAMHRPERAST
jgi:hypothetical protein